MALMISLFGLVNTAWAQTRNLEKSFPTVVMIEGQHNGTTSFGAGIVIGSRAGRIYIATARHVVKSLRNRGPDIPATDIKVQFKFLPGEKYAARLLDHPTTDLDLTVLSVSTSGGDIPVSEFDFKVLGDSGQLKRRSDVYPLGYPGATAWGVALNPEKVDTMKGSEISFQSSYIQKGHSGGALLDGCGDIVGLIVRDSPPNGEALRIESVIQELKSWGFPVNIEKSGGCEPAGQTSSSEVQVNGASVEQHVLQTGTSGKFNVSQPGGFAYFLYTPDSSGSHTISVISEPDRVDQGWGIYSDPSFNQLLVECDNDSPSRGVESCVANLQAGHQYSLAVSNLTGDEPGEPAESLEFRITISPDSVVANPANERGSISIRYTGDANNCAVNVEILLVNNNRSISPTSNFFNVNDLNLGQEYYEINGMISCGTLGSCSVSAEDSIFLQHGHIYDIKWQSYESGQCSIELGS